LTDVLVLGAGLAGLAAARDLAAGGADVVVLEARERPGGRVEQLRVDGGRPVQLGGEVVGPFQTAYLGLVEELGLTLEPSYTGLAGLASSARRTGPSRRRPSGPTTSASNASTARSLPRSTPWIPGRIPTQPGSTVPRSMPGSTPSLRTPR
jgi:monoamine oxidase